MEHGVDYIKALTKNNNSNIEKNIDVFADVSIIIAALVTSYARVFMRGGTTNSLFIFEA